MDRQRSWNWEFLVQNRMWAVCLVLLCQLSRVCSWSLWDEEVQFSAGNYRLADESGAYAKRNGWEEVWQAGYKANNSGEAYPGPWPRARRGHSLVKMIMNADDCVAGVGVDKCDPGVYIVLFGGRDNDGEMEHVPKTYNVMKNLDGTLNITTYDKKPVDPCFDDDLQYYTQQEKDDRDCDGAISGQPISRYVPVGFIYNDVWAKKIGMPTGFEMQLAVDKFGDYDDVNNIAGLGDIDVSELRGIVVSLKLVDNSVRIWDATTGTWLKTLQTHATSVMGVDFNDDDSQMVSGSRDGTVALWDVNTGTIVGTPLDDGEPVTSVAFSPDGAKVVFGTEDNQVRLWNTGGSTSNAFPDGHTEIVTSVAFNHDGTRVVSGSRDGTAKVWGISGTSGSSLDTLSVEDSDDAVTSACFSHDSSMIATGSEDHTVRLWQWEEGDAKEATYIKTLVGHTDIVTSVAFNHDGSKCVSGSYDHTVRIWDVVRGRSLKIMQEHTHYVTSVKFSADGSEIISGSYDGTIRFWDSETGKLLSHKGNNGAMEGHTAYVRSVAVSKDGTRVASGSGLGLSTTAEMVVARSYLDSDTDDMVDEQEFVVWWLAIIADKDMSGFLEFSEFTALVKELGADYSYTVIKGGYQQSDTDLDGNVDWQEFGAWWKAVSIFADYDDNDSGYIEVSEFKSVAAAYGHLITASLNTDEDVAEFLINQVDGFFSDGLSDREDFVNWWVVQTKKETSEKGGEMDMVLRKLAADAATEAYPYRCVRTWDSPCVGSGWISWHPGAQQGDCKIQLGIEVCTVPSERYEHGAVSFIDGAMYVYGGFSQRCEDFCDDMWFFDIFLKGWRQVYSAGRLSRFYDITLDNSITYVTMQTYWDSVDFDGNMKDSKEVKRVMGDINRNQYRPIDNVPMDDSTVPNAGPGKRWKHSMVGDGTRMAIFGGHRLWHGFSIENSQANDWELAETRPRGGYMNDMWLYTKELDFETVPGSTFKSSFGSWKLAPYCDEEDSLCQWPGSRAGHGSVMDVRRNLVWIFGGYRTYFPYLKTDGKGSEVGVSSIGVGGFVPYPEYDYYLRDLWYFNITNGVWTEVKAVKVQVISVVAHTPGMPLNPAHTFALLFRYKDDGATDLTTEVTQCIPITANEQQVRDALEGLPSGHLKGISVVRSGYGDFRYPYSFTWRVYFQGKSKQGALSAQFGYPQKGCTPMKEVMESFIGEGLLTFTEDFAGGCMLEMEEGFGGNLVTMLQPGSFIVLQNTTVLPKHGPQQTEYIKEVYAVEKKVVYYSKTEWDVCGFSSAYMVKVFVKNNILVSVDTEDDILPQPRSEMTMILVDEDNEIDKQVVNDTIIIHGGYANNFAFDDLWYFDLETGRWLEKKAFVWPDYPSDGTCTDDWEDMLYTNNPDNYNTTLKDIEMCQLQMDIKPLEMVWDDGNSEDDDVLAAEECGTESDGSSLAEGYWGGPTDTRFSDILSKDPSTNQDEMWAYQEKGWLSSMEDMFMKNASGEMPMEEHPAYLLQPKRLTYRSDPANVYGAAWENMYAQAGVAMYPYTASGPNQYMRRVNFSSEQDAVMFLFERCTSVYAEPTRGTVLDGMYGRESSAVMIPVMRRQRPGWDGCRDNTNKEGKQGLRYEKPTSRFSHAAVYVSETREIFTYGGMAYDQERLPSITETYSMAVQDDMWQFHLDHCVHNCSNHGDCMYGFCICHTGYYGVDCSNTSCPGTACFYDDLTHEQHCQHACQASYNHTDIDEYVQDAAKVRCSKRYPGEENGICDGYGNALCAPPFIGRDCAVRDCKDHCNYNGWCSVEFPVSRCMCNPGYYGETCEFQFCLNNCSYPNGVCDRDTGECNCRMRYSPYENWKEFKRWDGLDCSFLHAYAAAPNVVRGGFRFLYLLVLLVTIVLGVSFVDAGVPSRVHALTGVGDALLQGQVHWVSPERNTRT